MLNIFRLQRKYMLNSCLKKNSIHCQTKGYNLKYMKCIVSEKYTQNSQLGKLNKNRLIEISLQHMLNNFNFQMKYMLNSCLMKSNIHCKPKEYNSKYMKCTVSKKYKQYSQLGMPNKNHLKNISLLHMLNNSCLQRKYKLSSYMMHNNTHCQTK